MNHRTFECSPEELASTLLPQLRGRAFHVTTRTGYEGICRDRLVLPIDTGTQPLDWAFSDVSYFRKKGCVSVCDLRAASDEEIAMGMSNYYFLNPKFGSGVVVHLILGEKAQGRLITWNDAVRADGLTIQGVPRIESGHPSAIPLDEIDEVMVTQVRPRSDSAVHAAFEGNTPSSPVA
jgi:hypothetical protein